MALTRYQVVGALLVWWLSAVTASAEIYKYQDAKGRWHFTDKKPEHQHELVELKNQKKKPVLPAIRYVVAGEAKVLSAYNPWHGPVWFDVLNVEELLVSALVEPLSSMPLKKFGQPLIWQSSYRYFFRLGDPTAELKDPVFLPPVQKDKKYLITQGFGGPYSHLQQPNFYAIDIAMEVGEYIHAAKAGKIVRKRDDYPLGGKQDFFKDKANYVEVMHKDGTFAVYAHLLLGSVSVELGDEVAEGQVLARAGNSGYSTGPHLHFAVKANRPTGYQSLPFLLRVNGTVIKPRAGLWVQR